MAWEADVEARVVWESSWRQHLCGILPSNCIPPTMTVTKRGELRKPAMKFSSLVVVSASATITGTQWGLTFSLVKASNKLNHESFVDETYILVGSFDICWHPLPTNKKNIQNSTNLTRCNFQLGCGGGLDMDQLVTLFEVCSIDGIVPCTIYRFKHLPNLKPDTVTTMAPRVMRIF